MFELGESSGFERVGSGTKTEVGAIGRLPSIFPLFRGRDLNVDLVP